MRHLLLVLFLLTGVAAHAVEPSERLADPALEARARAISSQLRCLVCQNESIDESGADLAHDIRLFVRERLTAGDTDAQAIQALVNRYGQFVLLKPPVEPATYVLWYGPPILLVVGLVGSVIWLRRRQSAPAEGRSAQRRGNQPPGWADARDRRLILPFLLALMAFAALLPIVAPAAARRAAGRLARQASTRRSIATSCRSSTATSPAA